MLAGGYEESLAEIHKITRDRLGQFAVAQVRARDLAAEFKELKTKLAVLNARAEHLERQIAENAREIERYGKDAPFHSAIKDIQHEVARYYDVSLVEMLSPRRTARIVRPRHVAMYLAKTRTLRTLPEIGRRFGGRDHTTVLHAVRSIEEDMMMDADLEQEIRELNEKLGPVQIGASA